ncbi:MAG: PhoH family protein [Planctomycetota bacterium]|nr:PhoH family protein [Planctomycetota bacterium]
MSFKVPAGHRRVSVLGAAERNLKMLREALGVAVHARDSLVLVRGEREPVAVAHRVLQRLHDAADRDAEVSRQDVLDMISDEMVRAARGPSADAAAGAGEAIIRHPSGREGSRGWGRGGGAGDLAGDAFVPNPEPWDGRLNVYVSGRPVRPKTLNQERYLSAIRDHDLIFGVGPAGTGKTYLAVAAAVHLLKIGRVQKVILVRPAVEAGEKLGFLPGDMQAKVNPYLRPLLDALHDMMDFPTIRRFMDNDVVEVVPLAFMRGRTLNNSVIILDEAQNTTRGQMKMFLTRMGHGSKMIVTGDTTQIDLPDPRDSGLIDAFRRLRRTSGIGFITLDRADVVRHPMVQKIIDAYGDDDSHPQPRLDMTPGPDAPKPPKQEAP